MTFILNSYISWHSQKFGCRLVGSQWFYLKQKVVLTLVNTCIYFGLSPMFVKGPRTFSSVLGCGNIQKTIGVSTGDCQNRVVIFAKFALLQNIM